MSTIWRSSAVVCLFAHMFDSETHFNQWVDLHAIDTHGIIDPLQYPSQPAQALFYEHSDGVEEGARATRSQEHQETVRNVVSSGLFVLRSLAAHQVSKSSCAECNKAKIERF